MECGVLECGMQTVECGMEEGLECRGGWNIGLWRRGMMVLGSVGSVGMGYMHQVGVSDVSGMLYRWYGVLVS